MKDEYGIIFDIDHFAVHDGPGIRTVIYLKGCPLRCVWCHSPESHVKDFQTLNVGGAQTAISGRKIKASEAAAEILGHKVFFDSSGGGATLSGGEILFQPEFAQSLLARLQGSGVHTLAETSGMGDWGRLRGIAEYTDMFYYDIKTLDNGKHLSYTGAGNKLILDNLKKLSEYMPEKIVLRVPLIPGYNDTTAEITGIYELARGLRICGVHLLRYNISAPAKYEWLDLPYLPGNLERQSDAQIAGLIKAAPEEIKVTVF